MNRTLFVLVLCAVAVFVLGQSVGVDPSVLAVAVDWSADLGPEAVKRPH